METWVRLLLPAVVSALILGAFFWNMTRLDNKRRVREEARAEELHQLHLLAMRANVSHGELQVELIRDQLEKARKTKPPGFESRG